MLCDETLQQLKQLKLTGFVEALEEQNQSTLYETLSFEERLGLLVDREYAKRSKNKIQRLISQAKFQNSQACIEDVNYHLTRKIDRKMIQELGTCQYIRHARNVNIFGATGAGKSYLGQALGNAACRQGITTRYVQLPELLEQLKIAREQGAEKLAKLRKLYTNVRLLIIDEWLLFKIDTLETEMLIRPIDQRPSRHSTIVISQYEPAEWLQQISVHAAAEAITDRLTAQAYTIILESKESMCLMPTDT